jgi:hypothetical protein
MKAPQLTKVVSSNIEAVGHDDTLGLVIKFKKGGLYSYADAPRSLYHDMLQSRSPGKFFFAKVKDKFPHVQHDDR